MYGPTGLGILYGRRDALAALPAFLTGGSMIEVVHMDRSTFAAPPQRFEAGTPMVAQAVGLSAACDYLDRLGMHLVAAHEHALTQACLDALEEIDGLRVIGPRTTQARAGSVSFVVEGIHPHDLGQVLDDQGVEVRVGHHCAWPLMRRFGVPATTRASFGVHNGFDDITSLSAAIRHAQRFFGTG
jgi:cysteine desulfurase/selenocysteine lyase